MEGNFHGRTTTIVSFSTDSVATQGYAPYTPGFRLVPYGDFEALEAAIDETTVAVLLEPIQGEAGVIIPPRGLPPAGPRRCATARGVLMVADEIQSGLARTGRTFACDHEDVVPDIYILGKALGGGLYPVSAIAADNDVLGGDHARARTARPSAATRSLPRSGARWWRCSTRVSSRSAPRCSVTTSPPASSRWSARASMPSAPADCGPASTSTPTSRPDATSVRS